MFIVACYYWSSPGRQIESSTHSEINMALSSTEPALIYFYATWCGTCQEVAPSVSTFSNEIGTQAKVIRIDVDQYPDVAQQFGVSAIPTFVSIRDKKESAREVGAISTESMRKLLGL